MSLAQAKVPVVVASSLIFLVLGVVGGSLATHVYGDPWEGKKPKISSDADGTPTEGRQRMAPGGGPGGGGPGGGGRGGPGGFGGGPGGFGGGPGGGGPGGPGMSSASQSITAWVERTYTATTIGGVTVYDLTANVQAQQ